jgi:hypothetical protein
MQYNSTYPEAGYPITNYPSQLGPSRKLVENSKKLSCFEITGCRIKRRTMLWLLELQIRRGKKA